MLEIFSFSNDKRKRLILILISVLISGSYLFLCTVNVFYALVFVAVAGLLFCFYKSVELCFACYLFLIPFVYSPLFSGAFQKISLLKIEILTIPLMLLLFLISKKLAKASAVFYIFTILLMVLYIIGWIRSGDYAPRIFTLNLIGRLPFINYLTNYVSWTVLSFVPLLIIVYFFSGSKGIEKVILMLIGSVILFAAFLLMLFAFKVSSKSDFEAIRTELGVWLGMHGNDISNYCILAFPVILAWAFSKKNAISFAALSSIAAGTLLCFSRTGYFLVLFGFILFLFLTGRLKWIPVVAGILAAIIILLVPDMVIERAVTGFSSGDVNELSAGRVGFIWKPILQELSENRELFLFGSGRFGITNTQVWNQRRMPGYYHAHNMYLDCILDMGVIGLVIIMAVFSIVVIYFWKVARKAEKTLPYYSGILFGCITSVICFLLSGITGRTFFPNQGNFYLWIIFGLGFIVAEHVNHSCKNE